MISRPACALVAGTLTAALLGACSSGTATPTATGSGAGAASASANGIAGTQIDVLSLWAKGSPEGDALRRATDAFAAKTGAVELDGEGVQEKRKDAPSPPMNQVQKRYLDHN